MIEAEKFFNFLKKRIQFFTGVPDSVLKNFTKLVDKDKSISHYPVYNEGSAVSLSLGYHLATNKLACVYLQNSGLSNSINPLISIAHKNVYSIPSLLIIGWRGSPYAKKDEPQHNTKGRITRNLLSLLDIKYVILRKNSDFKKLNKLIIFAKKKNQTVACLIEKDTLILRKKFKQEKRKYRFEVTREFLIKNLLGTIKKNTKIVSTTGFTSRELFRIRENFKIKNGSDFYMIGGMGHSGMVALGISLSRNNDVICLDGDGSILMHFGSLKVSGMFGRANFKHILFNNASHESVGGQRTFVEKLPFSSLAKSLGYNYTDTITTQKNLNKKLTKFIKSKGPSFLEIKTKEGTLKNMGRPNNFVNIKNKFKK
jgi:phosphonopyruvate decarboxylase